MSEEKKALETIYPDEPVYKFDKEFADASIYKQETDVRDHISEVVEKQDIIDKIGFGEYLTTDVKYLFNTVLCTMMRYKRLNDLISQAANIGEITRNNAKWRNNWGDQFAFWEDKKENSTQWYVKLKEKGVLTSAQMKTLIKYSLDTPVMLYIILRENGFFYNWKDDKDFKGATEFRTQGIGGVGGKIFIGASLESGYLFGKRAKNDIVYLDVNGNFVTQRGLECSLLGLGAESMFDKTTGKMVSTNIEDIKMKGDVSFSKEQLVNTSGIGANVATVGASFFLGPIPLALAAAKAVADVVMPNYSTFYTSEKSKSVPIWTIDSFGAAFADKMNLFDNMKIWFNEKNLIQKTRADFYKATNSGIIDRIKTEYISRFDPKIFIKLKDTKKIGGTQKRRNHPNRRTTYRK